MVDEAGDWDWNRLSQWLPQDVLDKIATVKPPHNGLGADASGWHWEKNRNFSTRSTAQRIWEAIIDPAKLVNFNTMPFQDWLNQCFDNKIDHWNSGAPWAIHFSTICWLLWKQRHNAIFGSTELSDVILVKYSRQVADNFNAAHQRKTGGERYRQVSWSPLSDGWFKANCDGAVNPSSGFVAIGGVIWDEYGTWCFGFSQNIG
ncbi:hypothetical protein V6N11_067950 [Hibiscus sabdariffa]|uniref:RNase H type-1 domain-containing protein n=1 Tax=Hibiscus sabdariffa TaxID=183260 RepID=A0ABR2SS92_9ROSI